MNRRRKIIAAAAALFLVVGLFFALFNSGPPDPIYDGKHLSYWLTQSKRYEPPPPANQWYWLSKEPVLHFSKLGTNAVPYLLYAFQRGDGPARQKYAQLWPKVPGLLRRCLPQPRDTPTIRSNAGSYLYNLNAFDLPPVVAAMATILESNEDHSVRMDAAQFLGYGRTKNPMAVEALVHGLSDEELAVRMMSTNALRRLDPSSLTNAVSRK